jgi:calmodulin
MRTLGQNPTDAEIEQMIKEVDIDNNGEIDFGEFCGLMVKKLKESEPEEELVEVFKIFDKDGDGKIDIHDLDLVFKELGEKVKEEDLREMI